MTPPKSSPFLSRSLIQRGMRLSVAEGVAWSVMVGVAETYFIADAVRLGATPLELGLVVTLPLWIGAAGPLLALGILYRLRRRKPLVVTAACVQAAVLGAMALSELGRSMSPRLLIALICLYNMSGQTAGTAWASWFGDLVPRHLRGRHFAVRNRAVQLATTFALMAGGLILQMREPGAAATGAGVIGGSGFHLIFALGVLCRLVSATLLIVSPEPSFRGVAGRTAATRYLRSSRGRTAVRLLASSAAFYGAVYLASPYFAPFMLETLRFTYTQYMAASLGVVAAKSIMLPLWGRLLDRHGARTVFYLAAFLVALIPLPWLFAEGLGLVIVAQLLSGSSWSAYELAFFALLLDSSTKTTRPHVFATQSIMNGSLQLLGGVASGMLLGRLGGDYRALFAISMGGRLLVTMLMLIPVGRGLVSVRRRSFSWRVLGIRPNGGLGLRPVEAMSDAELEVETGGVDRRHDESS